MSKPKNSESKRHPFAHQGLRVYESAAGFVEQAQQLVNGLLSGNAVLSDQLCRASISVCLNIAEGAGAYRPKEKVRFYRIARRSETECAAIMDILRRLHAAANDDLQWAEKRLSEIVSMLTGLLKGLDTTER